MSEFTHIDVTETYFTPHDPVTEMLALDRCKEFMTSLQED
jgi:hypothetical protein